MGAPQPPSSSVQRASIGQARWRGEWGWRALARRRHSGSRRSRGGHHGRNAFARPQLAPPAAGAKAALISACHFWAGPLPAPSQRIGAREVNPAEPRRWLTAAPRPCPGVQSCSAGRTRRLATPHHMHRAGRAPTGPSAGAPTLPAAVQAHHCHPAITHSRAVLRKMHARCRGGSGRGLHALGCHRRHGGLPGRNTDIM